MFVARPLRTASWRTRLGAATLALAAGLLAACGSGGSASASVDATTVVKYLTDYLKDWYLWYGRLPAIDPSIWATPEEALAALKVPEDRFSFIEPAQTFNAFFDDARALGFGFGYTVVGTDVWVRLVQPQGTAAAAGMQRGDRIVAIDGEPTAKLLAEGRFDTALGPSQEGVTLSMTLLRDGNQRELRMTKGWYSLRNVLDARVIDIASGKVGYLLFYSFTEPARDEWAAALAQVRAGGATDLIVDLRENGGGRLSVANALASTLVPPGHTGEESFRLVFNDRHADAGQQFRFDIASGHTGRLVWITSPRTCSASETLIAAARPYRTAYAVGETSCGKPVGFTPPEYAGKVFNIVTFRSLNRDGFTDYFQGLAADCAVGEDYAQPYGERTEPKLGAALHWLETGRCTGVAAKAAPTRPQADTSGATGFGVLTGGLR